MQITRAATPTITDGLVIRYKFGHVYHWDGQISASRNGVAVQGSFPTMNTDAELKTFVNVLAQAYKDHQVLAENRGFFSKPDEPEPPGKEAGFEYTTE